MTDLIKTLRDITLSQKPDHIAQEFQLVVRNRQEDFEAEQEARFRAIDFPKTASWPIYTGKAEDDER